MTLDEIKAAALKTYASGVKPTALRWHGDDCECLLAAAAHEVSGSPVDSLMTACRALGIGPNTASGLMHGWDGKPVSVAAKTVAGERYREGYAFGILCRREILGA